MEVEEQAGRDGGGCLGRRLFRKPPLSSVLLGWSLKGVGVDAVCVGLGRVGGALESSERNGMEKDTPSSPLDIWSGICYPS